MDVAAIRTYKLCSEYPEMWSNSGLSNLAKPAAFVFREMVMKRETNLIGPLALLVTLVPLTLGQGVQGHPGPVTDDVLGPQLVAWSQVQKPEPVERPSPSCDSPRAQPDQHPAQTANQSNRQAPAPQMPAHQSAKDSSTK